MKINKILFLNSGIIVFLAFFSFQNLKEYLEEKTGNKRILLNLNFGLALGYIFSILFFKIITKNLKLRARFLVSYHFSLVPYFIAIVVLLICNDNWINNIVLIITSFMLGAFSANFHSINTSISYCLGFDYLKLLNLGTGLSGLILSVISLIIKLGIITFDIKTEQTKQLINVIFYSIVLLIFYIFSFYYVNSFSKNNIDKIEDNINSNNNKQKLTVTDFFRKASDYYFGLFYTITITFSIMPGLISLINLDKINALFRLSLLNVILKSSDCIGKFMPQKYVLIKDSYIRIYAIIRTLLLAIILSFINYGDYNYYLSSLPSKLAIIVLIGFSNGHLTSIMTANAARRFGNINDKNNAGYNMISSWLLGLSYCFLINFIYIN